jgi:hypothetical protein
MPFIFGRFFKICFGINSTLTGLSSQIAVVADFCSKVPVNVWSTVLKLSDRSTELILQKLNVGHNTYEIVA